MPVSFSQRFALSSSPSSHIPLFRGRMRGSRLSNGNALNGSFHGKRRSPAVHAMANGYQESGDDKGDYDYDLFAIGGGSGGVRAARYSSLFGAKVALCELPRAIVSAQGEKGGTGGTCVLRGCVPKKLLSYGGLFTEELENAPHFGWQVKEKPEFTWETLRENKNREITRLSDLYMKQLKDAKVDFIEGFASLKDPHTVEVDGKTYTAKNILIATGSTASIPPIEGAREHAITSDVVLDLPTQPKKLVVVGGGYIGCEQASIWNNLGAEVHLINRQDLPLTGFDNECRAFALDQYKHHGIIFHPKASTSKVEKDEASGKLTLTATVEGADDVVIEDVDYVLMATGRKPTTKGMGIEELGIELTEKKAIKVNEYSQSVSHPTIWAIGDVTSRKPLTPVARMEGSLLAMHLFGGKKDATPNYDNVASVVFSSPNLATVGLSEEAAVEKLGNVDIYTSIFTPMKHTLGDKDIKALAKVVVDPKSDKVVGVHMVGAEAAEIVQGFASALNAGITKTQLDETVGLHPTSAEEFVTLFSPKRQYRGGKKTDKRVH